MGLRQRQLLTMAITAVVMSPATSLNHQAHPHLLLRAMALRTRMSLNAGVGGAGQIPGRNRPLEAHSQQSLAAASVGMWEDAGGEIHEMWESSMDKVNSARRTLFQFIMEKHVLHQIKRRCVRADDLKVVVEAEGPVGEKDSLIYCECSSIHFKRLRLSGGGSMEASRKGLLYHLIFRNRPFEVRLQAEMNEDDVLKSDLVQSYTSTLIENHLAKHIPGYQLGITPKFRAVTLERDQLCIKGKVGDIPFKATFGVKIRENAQVLRAVEPKLTFFPGAPVLEKVWEVGTLPPGVPLPLLREVNEFPLQYEGPSMDILDIGPRARIDHIMIEEGKIIAIGNATISPTPPFLVAMPEEKAKFTYDLGSFLSSWIFISAPVHSTGALPYLAVDPILFRRAGFCAALFMLTLLSNVLEGPLQMLGAVRRRIGALMRLVIGRRKRKAARHARGGIPTRPPSI